jgi:oxaloacetate decarboxylase (Na+ extruding) subunit gamma
MTDLLKEGLVLMGVGMGVVFALLAVLVLVVHAVSRLGRAFAPAPAPASVRADSLPDDELTAVISAAIEIHRRRV